MPAIVKRNKVKAAKKVAAVEVKDTVVSQGLKNKKENRKKLTKELRKSGAIKRKRRGVVYIKHLPHGFYEEQLRKYFTQFGAITRLRLARSKKTLNSKGYAFIEFRYPEVAEIAADAMNNYMMFKNVIKTVFIPADKVKFDYFKHGLMKINKNGKTVLTSTSIEAKEGITESNNRLMTKADVAKRAKIVGAKINKTKAKLAALGIDYDVDALTTELDEDMKPKEIKATGKTINDLSENEDDDMASGDETFDPMNMEVDSDHSVDDFEYDSEDSEDEENDGIEVNIDEAKLKTAVSKARLASVKLDKTALLSSPKPNQKKTIEAAKPQIVKTAPVEKKTVPKRGKQVAPVVKKESLPARGAKKAAVVVKPVKELEKKASPVKAGKKQAKVVEKAAPVVKAVAEKKVPAKAAPVEKKAGKKEQKVVEVVPPVVVKPKGRAAKKTAPVVVESPVQTKTKKLQKTSVAIEKKKPAAKVGKAKAEKLMEAAKEVIQVKTKAAVKATVTAVKGKKKVAAAKK